MNNNDLLDFYKIHRVGQEKYTYFLLAVSASAVAFAVQKTEGLRLTYSMIPLGLAVLSWGFSFYFGVRNLYIVQACITGNYALLQIQKDNSIEQNQKIDISKQIKDSFDRNSGKATRYGKCQFVLLLTGAVLFLVWHIIEMVRLTIN